MGDIQVTNQKRGQDMAMLREKAEAIVGYFPSETLEPLIALDGITSENAVEPGPHAPFPLHITGFASGAMSGKLVGPGTQWLTPLGQMVVDVLLGRDTGVRPNTGLTYTFTHGSRDV